MDRAVRNISSNNGTTRVCTCFRGTCGICAPLIAKKTKRNKSVTSSSNKGGEETNE